MIPTFILKPAIEIIAEEHFNIQINKFQSEQILYNLKNAIEWAIENDEDVIYCICDETNKSLNDFQNLEQLIYELVQHKLYIYCVDSIHKVEIPIDSNLTMLSKIEKVKSFIISQPMYRFILSILIDEYLLIGNMETLFNRYILHPIAINSRKDISPPLVESHIRVIAPFRNIANYIDDFIKSIEIQKYKNYTVYFVDDASLDDSVEYIPKHSKYITKINKERKYAVENVLSVLKNNDFGEKDIICLIDPDDYLPHGYVFQILNNAHSCSKTLITYGTMGFKNSFGRFGGKYSQQEFNSIRNQDWLVAHIKTFKFKLFQAFLNQDPDHYYLKDEDGKFLKMPCDMAFMFPMMELCDFENVKFIEAILYEYRFHDNNDMSVNRDEQYKGELIVRDKKRLKPAEFLNN